MPAIFYFCSLNFNMRYSRWLAICSAILLVISFYLPWFSIPSRQIIVTGFNTSGTRWSPPANFHLIVTGIYLALVFIPVIWVKRLNIFIAAINLSWAIGNFLRMSACIAGECPEKHSGIYLALLATILMLLASFFPNVKLKDTGSGN